MSIGSNYSPLVREGFFWGLQFVCPSVFQSRFTKFSIEKQINASALFPDEDRLSKRMSIGETISLQVEVESRNSPEKEEVKAPKLKRKSTVLKVTQLPHHGAFFFFSSTEDTSRGDHIWNPEKCHWFVYSLCNYTLITTCQRLFPQIWFILR